MMDTTGGGFAPAPVATRRFNPFEAAIGVITRPAAAMREIAAARPWPIAFALTIAIALLGGLAGLIGQQGTFDEALDNLRSADAPPGLVEAFAFLVSPGGSILTVLLSTLIFAPLGLLLLSGIYYGLGRLLGGAGPFTALLSTQAFAAVPSVLQAPLTALLGLLQLAAAPAPGEVSAGQALLGLLGLAVGLAFLIWRLVLRVIGVRESLALSTGRAAAVVLIPIGILILLSCVLVFILAAALGAALGNP